MPNLILRDNLHLLIEADETYLKKIKKAFTFKVPNYFWNPKFRSGIWDGTTCLLKGTNVLPYGLLFDLIKVHKSLLPDVKLEMSDDVKYLFKQEKELEIIYDLKFFPRDYQQESIEACLKYTKCCIVSATGSGKSLIISYVLKSLRDNNLSKRQIIIVPTTSLVQQFYDDMIDYGINKGLLGKIYAKEKEFDKTIVISTWQSLAKNHDILKHFDTLVCDEVHRSKSHELSKIIKKCPARYRFGFTGTLPSDKLDVFHVKSYLGPVIKTFTSGDLADLGYISKINVNMIYINYNQSYSTYGYDDLKDILFQNRFRLNLIKEILKIERENFLILVGKVEKEGEVLQSFLKEQFPMREVVFISGKDDIKEREYWRSEMQKRKNIVLIATVQLFQEGVNIQSLKYLIMAAPFKSKIRNIQSIGRTSRKFQNKIDGAEIFDIVDNTKYFREHGTKRYKDYMKENFSVKEINIYEGQEIDGKLLCGDKNVIKETD